MQIQIDGKSISTLSPEQEARINLGKALNSVSARVLSLGSASNRASKLTRFLVATHVGLATIVISSIVISLLIMSATEAQALILGASAVLEMIVISMALIIGRSQKLSWAEHLEASLPLLPPTGTVIHLDETALTVGDRRFHWTDVRIANVTFLSRQDRRHLQIERLVLTTPKLLLITLDAQMIENGQALINEIYRRLRLAS